MPLVSLRVAVLAAAVLALAPAATAAPEQCKDTRLSRTFEPPPARAAAAVPTSAFELTRDDFLAFFPFGTQVQIGLSPYGETFPMDVGYTEDAAAPGEWTVPDIDFETVVWTVVDPAATPYASLYPTSTHVLVTEDDPSFDGTQYQFHTFADAQLVFDGYLDVPAGGAPLDDPYDAPIAPFPLNTATEFSDYGYFYYDGEYAEDWIDPDQPYPVAQTLGFHGFGTLARPDGSAVDVGGFYADFNVFEPDGSGELFEAEVMYSFVGVDGTWLNFWVALPPGGEEGVEYPAEGEVYVEYVEYWEVVPPAPTAGEAGPGAEAAWSLYPNPTTDVVRFSEPLTATVFDVMGRAVREANRAREVDLRGLAAGTYVVRSEAGRSRTVTVRR